MSTNNMGTPGHPEGIPHWTNKTMYRQKLEQFRKLQKGFWLFFDKCCGQCEGGSFVENILKDVTAVEQESDYGPYRPDIVLRRGTAPARIIEIVATSRPSQEKIDYFMAQGVDLFEIAGDRHHSESVVINVHIAPSNCRKRQRERLDSLWQHLVSLDDPRIGIREDFRSEERKAREFQERERKWELMRQGVANGDFKCARCGKGFESGDDGFSFSQTWKHLRDDGTCGNVPFCDQCSFEVRGGWNGEYPDDAEQWGLSKDCLHCSEYLQRNHPSLNEPPPPTLLMRERGYSRLVHSPKVRTQQYVVGERTVSREELQSIAMRLKFALGRVAKTMELENDRRVAAMIDQLDKILKAIMFANNIYDWDWLEGVGESYLPEFMDTGNLQGDIFFYPKP